MRRSRFGGTLLAVLALTLSVGLPTAEAGTQPQEDVRSVLDRVGSGAAVSDADREFILKRPDLAEMVADPEGFDTGSEVVTSLPPAVADGALTAAATRCGAWRDHWVRARTFTGRTFYKFHQYMRWCYNGASVTRIEQRYAYINEASVWAYYEGVQTDSYNSPPAGEVNSFMKGRVDNCLPDVGCISTQYPWVRIRAGNNGSSIGSGGGAR